jgi:beta-glucuronidase
MRALIVLLLLLCATVTARAQGPEPGTSLSELMNVDGRTIKSLDGNWQTIVDPYENGYYDYRLQPSRDGYFRNQKPRDKSDRVEYDFDSSPELQVPGDWNSQDDRLFFYEGTVWYKKSFEYAPKASTRLFVYFGAANYTADVYLNGEKVGFHEGGFTPFNFEVTGRVRSGENVLVVKVDNKRRRDAVPTVNTDWWNYGGLTRRVALVEVPETFIRSYFVQLEKGSQRRVSGWVRLDGTRLRQTVNVSIAGAKLSRSFTTDDTGYAAIAFDADLSLWSPENPTLYDVALAGETDTVRERIGFRSIEVKGTDILLNGSPVFLRGICIHEEAPFRGGRAWSAEDARVLLGWAKELGCNFVRLAHYPHNESMVRAADEMGLLVWSEVPVYWTILWDNPATFANAKAQLTEMIARDRNRASIILWSMANETPVSDVRVQFLSKLAAHARSMDSTRLLTAALEHHYVDEKTVMIDDPFGRHLDVIGCNEYVGWYDGLPEKADTIVWKTIYDKPLVMSEFGGDAQFGRHGDALTRWTEEYQASLFEHQIGMLRKIPFLRGTTPWILMDFRSPRRPLPGIQDYWNRKGLVSNRGERKKAFFVLQDFYREMKETPRRAPSAPVSAP